MTNETVTVINELCSKIGIAVDWTQENIVPQITELIQRYRVYSICSEGIYTALVVIFGVLSICVFCSIIKNVINKNEKSIWYNLYQSYSNDIYVYIVEVGSACIFLLCAIVFFVEINSIGKWVFIPEVRFYEVILSVMK